MQLRRATLAGAFVALAAVLILGESLWLAVRPARVPELEEAVQHFEQLAFRFDAYPHRLPLKWRESVGVALVGSGADRFAAEADWAIQMVASLTGLTITIEPEVELGDLVILLTEEHLRETEARELGIEVAARLSFEEVERGFAELLAAENSVIQKAFVYVSVDTYDRYAVLLHELLHALGFFAHSDTAGRSVMATSSPVARPSSASS